MTSSTSSIRVILTCVPAVVLCATCF